MGQIEDISSKRTFTEIRDLILLGLASGQKTINQISINTAINWKTVENHLVYLTGKSLVKEVFSSSYVRVYELTAFGKDYLRQNGSRMKFTDTKIINFNGST